MFRLLESQKKAQSPLVKMNKYARCSVKAAQQTVTLLVRVQIPSPRPRIMDTLPFMFPPF